jgi:hypothetical protein
LQVISLPHFFEIPPFSKLLDWSVSVLSYLQKLKSVIRGVENSLYSSVSQCHHATFAGRSNSVRTCATNAIYVNVRFRPRNVKVSETGQHCDFRMKPCFNVLLCVKVPIAVVILLHWVSALLAKPRRENLISNDRYTSDRSATEV